MTLEQLRIFIAVAEREHMTRAAQALNLTQAAVSASIAALESQSGTVLFDRVGRNIALTPAGRLFLPEAREVLARAQAAQAVLDDISGLQRGQLRLHASQTIASYFLPAFIAVFHARHPGVALDLAIGNTAQAEQAVRAGTADLGFVEGPLETADLTVLPIATEEMGIYVPASHPWANGQPLTLPALTRAPWIFREPGSGTREAFLAALTAQGVSQAGLTIALTLPSNEAVREAVIAGAGVACLSPLVCIRAVQAGALARANFALPARHFHAVRHPRRYFTQAARAFLTVVHASGAFPVSAGSGAPPAMSAPSSA
ncbi:LysR family transcriptional regulator [Acidocella sp.]|uniref:LysR family transcriptional regulator n=1 Tax=Acidocella sp. TaxID=50710 RepID=UPI0026080964|nr:LysR family transcriptional regulator [Acidocella sp.]